MPFQSNPVGVFRDRKTYVTFDEYIGGIIQPWMAIQRPAEVMAVSNESRTENVVFVPEIGWRLRAYQADPGDIQELTAGQDGFLAGSWGSTWEAEDTFTAPGLLGVTYAGSVPSTASPYYQKRIPAGDTWSDALADGGSYSSPNTSEDATDMDRSFVSTSNIEPWDSLTFSFYVPGNSFSTSGPFLTFYFNGPAGSDPESTADANKLGTGQYALKCRGDGKANLYERLADNSWKFRFSFFWSNEDRPVRWEMCTITIYTDCYMDLDENWQGSKITFLARSMGDGPQWNDVMAAAPNLITKVANSRIGKTPVFRVPRATSQPSTLTKVRIDCRRDIRAFLQVARHSYPASGTLLDDWISFDFPLTADYPLTALWKGTVPTGCDMDCEMFAVDFSDPENPVETALVVDTATTATDDLRGFWARFTPLAGMRYARVRITFTSASGDKTPTLTDYSIWRDGIWDESTITPTEIPYRETGLALPGQIISDLSISGQETDPSSESATLTITDFTGRLDMLRLNQMPPIKIETVYGYDGEDPPGELRAVLFRGYVAEATQIPIRRSKNAVTAGYPAETARTFHLQCTGEWARLYEAFTERRYTWGTNVVDDGSPETMPWKVTDAIRSLLYSVYPESMVDVPDLDIRFFSVDQGNLTTEPGTRILDAINSYAADYLGAYLVFDEAAGDYGMWRLLEQKVPPYNNLAAFERELMHPDTPVTPGQKVLPHVSDAYGTTLAESGQVIKHTFMQAGTITMSIEKAEGNILTVFGGGIGNDSASGPAIGYTQTAIKTDSFNLFGLAPSHEHYPDGSSPEYYGRYVPLRLYDYYLTTQDAVDWKCKRVFDVACWARKRLTFTAPMLLVTDDSDTQQSQPRRLRYYDPVLVRNEADELEQYLVVSCRPTYQADHIQMAEYTVVTQDNINEIGVMPRSHMSLMMLTKMIARMQGKSFLETSHYSAVQAANAPRMLLPELPSQPLQDLDPESPSFGQFNYLPDYGFFDTDAKDWRSGVLDNGGEYSRVDMKAVSNFFTALKDESLLSKLPLIGLMAGQNLAASVVGYKPGTGAEVFTNVNFVEADFDPSLGLTGNGSKYLLTSIVPNNAQWGASARLETTLTNASARSLISCQSSGTTIHRLGYLASTGATSVIGTGTGNAAGEALNPMPAGFYTATRIAANNAKLYRNGVQIGSNTTAIVYAPTTHVLTIFANNNGGTGIIGSIMTGTLSSVMTHHGLTAAEAAILHTLESAFQAELRG